MGQSTEGGQNDLHPDRRVAAKKTAGILMHGLPGAHRLGDWVSATTGAPAPVAGSLLDMLLGLVAGGLALGAVTVVSRLRALGTDQGA